MDYAPLSDTADILWMALTEYSHWFSRMLAVNRGRWFSVGDDSIMNILLLRVIMFLEISSKAGVHFFFKYTKAIHFFILLWSEIIL